MKPIISPMCQQELQHDLNYLSSWCSEWKLKLNLSKCAAMCVTISSRSRIAPASYNIQHQQISSTNKQKDLGVIFTSNLSWLDHFNIICSKAYRSLNLIRRLIPSCSSNVTKKALYLTLVRSHLSYCSQVWSL